MQTKHFLPAIALLAAFALGQAERVEKEPLKETPSPATSSTKENTAGGAAQVQKKQPETLWEFAVSGGWMMLPLTLASVVWITFLLERLIALQRKKVIPPKLASDIQALIEEKPLDRGKARAILDSSSSAAGRVLRAALDRLDLPQEKVDKGVNNVAQREIYLLRHNIWIFAVVSAISPLMGLLGTVMGLVQAFREVAISGLGAGETLAPGIYEALVTTVGGLAVAIPAIATYYWLMARVDHFIFEIDKLVVDFVEASELAPAAL